ncbi:hypothetical protein CAAN1_11S03840 [[Candida] anglica]|uniref:FHA domain-containing protein n=1 Tax=[Candida] anglica TaxID=148631 RepID=A0ABP0EK10_9ASCO
MSDTEASSPSVSTNAVIRKVKVDEGQEVPIKRASYKDQSREAKENNLFFHNTHLSKNHASLKFFKNGLYIRDCSSTFGTVLNGQVLSPTCWFPLENNDVVRFIILKPSSFISDVFKRFGFSNSVDLLEFENAQTGLAFQIAITDTNNVWFTPMSDSQLKRFYVSRPKDRVLIHPVSSTGDQELPEGTDGWGLPLETEDEESNEDGNDSSQPVEVTGSFNGVGKTTPGGMAEENDEEDDDDEEEDDDDDDEDEDVEEVDEDDEEVEEDEDEDHVEGEYISDLSISDEEYDRQKQPGLTEEDSDWENELQCCRKNSCDEIIFDDYDINSDLTVGEDDLTVDENSSVEDDEDDEDDVEVYYITNRKRLHDEMDDDYDELDEDETVVMSFPSKKQKKESDHAISSTLKTIGKEVFKGSLYVLATVVALGVYGQSILED